MGKSLLERLQPILQSTLLWGCACMFATITLTVIAVTVHDFRWTLGIAWPFAVVGVWEFARLFFTKRRTVVLSTFAGAIISAIIVGWMYFDLAPNPQPPEPPSPSAPQPDFVEKLRRATPQELRALTSGVSGELRIFQNEISVRNDQLW